MFFSKSKKIEADIISQTYQNIIERSRSKFFYLNLEIEDSFEARFDIIIFHSFLIFHYFKQLNENRSQFAQKLFDFMFSDFDNNLREMGFGDIAVNKKMKVFISAFYGRISQYSKGIEDYKKTNNDTLLKTSISNNIYKGKKIEENYISFFSEYAIHNIDKFISQNETKNIDERFQFIELPSGKKSND